MRRIFRSLPSIILHGTLAPWPLLASLDAWRTSSCAHAISVIPPLLNTIIRGGGGGFTLKKFTVSQLSALAIHTPILGRIGQGAWELGLPQIRKCHFLSDPCVFGYIF